MSGVEVMAAPRWALQRLWLCKVQVMQADGGRVDQIVATAVHWSSWLLMSRISPCSLHLSEATQECQRVTMHVYLKAVRGHQDRTTKALVQ